MRKWIVGFGAAAFMAGTFVVATPSQAASPEGIVAAGGVIAACTEQAAIGTTGTCSWDSSEPNGWVGVGPFTITYTDATGSHLAVDCAAGAQCQSPMPDPIPAGVHVTADPHGAGGGTFAAGDADPGSE